MAERVNFRKIIKASAMTLAATGLSCGLASSPIETDAQSETRMPDNPVCVAAHLSDHHLTEKDIDAKIARLVKTGAKTTRFDVELGQINTAEGEWDFSRYDYIINKLKENGIQAIALLDQFAAPEWESQGDSYDYMNVISTPEEFGNFAGKFSEHFKDQDVLFEIANEENINWESNKGPNAETYVKYLNSAYDSIKEVDPKAQVLVGGLTAHDGRDWLTNIIKNGGKFDGVGVHVYDIYSFNIVVDFKQILIDNNMGKKNVYVTEFGWPTTTGTDEAVTPEVQAENITTVYQQIKDGEVPAVIACVYEDQDENADTENPDSNENHYGVYQIDGTEKLAVKALQDASASFDSN